MSRGERITDGLYCPLEPISEAEDISIHGTQDALGM